MPAHYLKPNLIPKCSDNDSFDRRAFARWQGAGCAVVFSPHFSQPPWSARCCPADRAGRPRGAMPASGKRLDALCRRDRRVPIEVILRWGPGAALRVAPRRAGAASFASTVASATLFGPLLAGRSPGRDADRGGCENCGLAAENPGERFSQILHIGDILSIVTNSPID